MFRRLAMVFVATMLFGATVATPATADTVLDLDLEQQYLEVFEEKGIPAERWDALLEKVKRGETLDADRPGISVPVSVETLVEDGIEIERSTFSDGTVSELYGVSESTILNDGIQLLGAQAKSCSTSGKLKNCRIVYDGISFSYSFRAEFTPSTAAVAKATVSAARGATIHRALGHTTSEVTAYVARKTQSGVTPAHGRMKFQMTALGIVGSRTIYLDLKVRDHQYWVETNL